MLSVYYKNSFIAFFFLFFPFSFLPTDLSHPAFFGLEEHDDPKRNQDHITKELGEAVLFLGNAGEEETRLAKERRAVYNPPFCLAQRGFYWRHFRFSTLVVIYSRRGAAGYSRPRSGNLFGLLPISFFSSAFLSAFLSISLEFFVLTTALRISQTISSYHIWVVRAGHGSNEDLMRVGIKSSHVYLSKPFFWWIEYKYIHTAKHF